jgi:hypothetical protein
LRLTALYYTSSEVKDLQNHITVGFPWDEKYLMYWEPPTGIPPHVIELEKMAELKRMVGEILPGVECVVCQQLDDRTLNEVLSETQMRNLMGEVFDERVMPFALAMAANREGGDMTRPPARERPSGALQETEERGFYIFNNHGKLRRVPEDWKFPHCPLATGYELYHCGDEIRGISPVKRFEVADVDYLKRGRQNLLEFKYLMS